MKTTKKIPQAYDKELTSSRRIKQESESFLASLHSSPGFELSASQNMSNKFNKTHKMSQHEQPITT